MAYKLVINGYCSPITISISGGQNTLVVIAKDAANNQSQITHTIIGSLSSTGLALFVNSLPSITSMKDIEIGGLASGNNVVVKINDSPVSTDSNGDFRQLINLSEGVNSIRIFARDSDGNEEEKIFSITCDSIPPILNIIKPIENSLVNSTFIEGTVEDASRVTVQANGLGLTIKNGRFSGGARLLSTGNTQIEIIAKDEAGNETMAVRNVTIDVSSPNIIDIIPIDMTIVNSSSVAIKGKVNDDIAVASVVVNQVLATIDGSGQFTANNVPIIQGPNKIVITATDTVGNKSEQSLILTGKDITPPPLPIVFPVISPTRLSTQTILGRSEPGSIITITGGVSLVSTEAVFGSGLFFANVDLVQGNNVLTITAKDKDQNTSIPAQVQVFSDPNLPLPLIGQPYLINLSTGDTQRGLVNMELPRPLTTIVTDQAGNPLANVPVTYSLSQGDGTFVGGNTIFQTVTDSNGQANARYIAGSSAGVQIIQAGFQGNILSPILFLAEVFDGSLDDPTTVSGIVLDQNLRALPNALIRISGQQARTRGDGRFIISNVSAGPHQLLEVVGRDQISIPGRWPNISYDIDVLPGIDNNLGRPLFLPRVNEGIDIPLDSAGVVTEDTSTELVLKNDKPPIKITARAGTRVIFPPDVTDKRLSVTNIREDRVPMSLEDGLFTSLYISVQPSGAVFDPPLEVTFPNVDLLSANSLVLLMSFDHDAGRYIRVGTGQVSADGQSISSDVGSGIRVGAWHAFPPPAPIPSGSVSANSSNDVCQCEIWAGGQRGINIGMNSTRQFVVPNIPAASSRKVSVQGNCGSCITVQTIELLDMMGNNLEPNPVSYGGGVRIFTDAEMRGGTPKRKIKVKIRVASSIPNTPLNQTSVHLRSFDVDDSAGIFATGMGNDNQGPNVNILDPVPTYGEFEMNGQKIPQTPPKSIEIKTDPNGEATVDFVVTTQPGDNFKIVAGTDKIIVESLSIANNSPGKAQTICCDQSMNLDEKMNSGMRNAIVSELLTVWRKLHVEVDSMPDPPTDIVGFPTNDPEKNFSRGNIIEVRSDATTSKAIEVKLNPSDVPELSGSVDLIDYSRSPGRYSNGRITIGSDPAVIDLDGNNGNIVKKQAGISITYELRPRPNTTAPILSGLVVGMVPRSNPQTQGAFILSVPTNIPAYIQGKLNVAGQEFTVLGFVQGGVLVREIPMLPFMLEETDDLATSPFLIPPPPGLNNQSGTPFEYMQTSDDKDKNLFAPAYIMPVYDLVMNNRSPSFNRNVSAEDLDPTDIINQIAFGRENPRDSDENDYWVVYLQGGFQEDTSRDQDSNNETELIDAFTSPLFNEGAIIFVEAERDASVLISNMPISSISAILIPFVGNSFGIEMLLRKITIPHEVGHQLGLSEGTSTSDGIMLQNAISQQTNLGKITFFTPQQIEIMRKYKP